MIVTVNCPNNAQKVNYGATGFPLDSTHQLEVPDYVAKSVITLAGFTCSADLSATYAALLGADEPYEANYLFGAYSKALPDPDDRIAEALTLLGDNGPPSVSFI